LTSQTAYDSFGNATGSLATRYGFTGREYDDFTGLMYYRARFYDPKLGRFISEDPIGFYGGQINLFGYVGNNPIGWKDPLGLDIVGFSGGASIWGGVPGPSAGGTGGILVGTGSDGFGSAASYGGFYGPGHTAFDTKNNAGWAAGLGAGVGPGVFWTNADKWCELGGDFETTIIGFGPVAIQIDAGDNNTYVVQVNGGGAGASYGITHFRTHTPATGRFSDALDDAGRKFRNGIRDNFGY